jgi:hypothetical protein
MFLQGKCNDGTKDTKKNTWLKDDDINKNGPVAIFDEEYKELIIDSVHEKAYSCSQQCNW